MSDTPFDPARHLIVYKRQSRADREAGRPVTGTPNYLEVKWRLVWLRTADPLATVDTELVEHDASGRLAIFKATVTLSTSARATGWGSETGADFTDYVEKAETKAIGRALAALGFGTQHAMELDEGGSVADSPVERPARPAPASATASVREVPQRRLPPPAASAARPAADKPVMTPEQVAAYKRLAAAMEAKSHDKDDVRRAAERVYGAQPATGYTVAQVDSLTAYVNGHVTLGQRDGVWQFLDIPV